MNSQWRALMMGSSCWSAREPMNSSFSRSLPGVSNRISSARSLVWSGWSMVTMWSLCGSR